MAMVLVCEKCGKRIGDDKNRSHRLASHIKKAAKRRLAKGDLRIVITSCMKVCPDDRIAACIAPSGGDDGVSYYTVPAEDLESSADAIVDAVVALTR